MPEIKTEPTQHQETIMESIENANDFEVPAPNNNATDKTASEKKSKATKPKKVKQKGSSKAGTKKKSNNAAEKRTQSDGTAMAEPALTFPLPGSETTAPSAGPCDRWRPAAEMMPELPDEANPVDQEIFQRLAECWDTEAKAWTPQMRRSMIKHVPRARVTKSTAKMSNHNLSKLLRGGMLEPNWGSFVILRTIFGLSNCAKHKWFDTIAEHYPEALNPAFDGVCQENMDDVFDGKAEIAPRLQRKRGIRQLGPEKRRSSNKKIKLDNSEDAILGRFMLGNMQDGAPQSSSQPEHIQEKFQDTVNAVQRFNPQEAILSLKQRYDSQTREMERLAQSNQQILEAIGQYRAYVGMLRSLEMNIMAPASGSSTENVDPSLFVSQEGSSGGE